MAVTASFAIRELSMNIEHAKRRGCEVRATRVLFVPSSGVARRKMKDSSQVDASANVEHSIRKDLQPSPFE